MVPKIDKILFASDLTESSRYAFRYASSIASHYGASLVLLHVLENLKTGMTYRIDSILGEGYVEKMRAQQKDSARNALIGKRSMDQELRSGLAGYFGSAEKTVDASFDVIISEGEIEDELIKTAKEKGCDLIVIGTHKGLLGGTAVSSIIKGVLSHAMIPVLVVPPPENE